MIVMGIFVLLLVAGMPAFLDATSSGRVNLAAQKVQGALANARARAVANNSYVAAVFYTEDKNSHYFLTDLYRDPAQEEKFYAWRLSTGVEAFPANTMIPASGKTIESSAVVLANDPDDATGSRYRVSTSLFDFKKVKELDNFSTSQLKPVIFTPKGGLAGTDGKHLVIHVVQSDEYPNNKFYIPINVNFLSGKAKILPSEKD